MVGIKGRGGKAGASGRKKNTFDSVRLWVPAPLVPEILALVWKFKQSLKVKKDDMGGDTP